MIQTENLVLNTVKSREQMSNIYRITRNEYNRYLLIWTHDLIKFILSPLKKKKKVIIFSNITNQETTPKERERERERA